jgi:hypothetical protein
MSMHIGGIEKLFGLNRRTSFCRSEEQGMKAQSIAGQLGERRTRFALSAHAARSAKGPDNTNKVMWLALGVLVVAWVAVGSALILADMNDNMVTAAELMALLMRR